MKRAATQSRALKAFATRLRRGAKEGGEGVQMKMNELDGPKLVPAGGHHSVETIS
jgi:hypothetical protein